MKNKEEKLNIKNLNAVIELGRKLLHITLILLLIIGIYAITLIFKE